MMRSLIIGSLATAVILVGIAFAIANIWMGLLFCLLIGALWGAGLWVGRSGLVALALAGLILVTAVGGSLGVSPTLLITGIALALFAWTMGNVAQQLTAMSEVLEETELIKKHVQWAGGVIGAGWLLGVIALNLQLALTFGWVLLAGIVVVSALSLFVRRLRQTQLP